MPVQQTKVVPSVAKRLGAELATAHGEVAGNEYRPTSGGDVPSGIQRGVARLTRAWFGVYEKGENQGKFYFMASAVVVDVPQEHLKWAVGLQTRVGPLPLCATKNKTIAENLDAIYNIWRGFGVDTSKIQASKEGALEATAKALQDAGIYFHFRTWHFPKRAKTDPKYQEKYDGPDAPEPRVNSDWGQAIEYVPTGDAGGVDDATAVAPAPIARPGAKAAPKTAPAPEPEPEPVEYSDTEDLDSLLATALGDDADAATEAQGKITEQALTLGFTQEQVNGAESWETLVEQMKAGGPPAADDAAEWEPKKEEIYQYAPIDPKTKKPGKKGEWEVTAVDAKKRTVTLRNLTNRKLTVPGVSWDKLESTES